MDYDAYVPDSSRWAKSGLAYRVLGHDAATYYQYAIYVSERHRNPPRFSPAANPRGRYRPGPIGRLPGGPRRGYVGRRGGR